MNFEHFFKFLSGRFRDEIIVTSAGNCSELWWETTGKTERVFYLEASMSLASLFAAGIALSSRTGLSSPSAATAPSACSGVRATVWIGRCPPSHHRNTATGR